MLKAIVLDDNKYAISNLKKYLKELNVDVLAESMDVEDVFEMVREHNPDIIFLDIDFQNQKYNGVNVVNKLTKIKSDIVIIYATAHSEFALEVLQSDGIVADYILKPFSKIKVQKSLNKAKKMINKSENDCGIKIKDKERNIIYIKVDDIYFIEREKNAKNVIIHCGDNAYDVAETLQSFEDQLSKYDQFVRSHKSYIINKSKIEKVSKLNQKSYIVEFKNYEETAIIVKQNLPLI